MDILRITTFSSGNDSVQLRLNDHQFPKQSPDYFVVLKLFSLISGVETEVMNMTLQEIADNNLVTLTDLKPYTT